uniref:WD repeat and coiled-coil-containing protein isoform X2 n=1 Tax=Myodes glareolus TaxID=447135 RepID=UPI00201FCA6F|nr:WD repeat and coiled-coil-containing protein isoform X2 [Myodes glareolus]
MELGNGKLLRTGLNSLNQAVHPTHGLAWTDGNRVILTDLRLQRGVAKFGDSQVIGKFEYVCGVSWAPLSIAHTPTLLAIQHQKHVAVWQLCPSTSGSSKWQMSQTSEIRESLPILPQGCVWHPKDAVLTVLTAQDVSVFPNIHRDGCRVKVDINTKGRIYCACWTLDGQRLVVAVDSSLHSYMWDSSQRSLQSCSFCPVFQVSRSIRSIAATADSQKHVGPAEERAVLLCEGKLRLSTVQQMFGLYLVEMLHDSHWILLSADSQGFIPLTFAASQMVVVRDGSLSTPELARGSPSHNRDPILPPGGFGDFAAQNADTAGCFSSVA